MARREGSTEERLLDAAEQLFGEHGYDETSLRAVTELAGANVAAVNYHYGSKEGLLRAVVGRAMAPINAERDRRLTALSAGPDTPTVEQLVRAFVEPALTAAPVGAAREGAAREGAAREGAAREGAAREGAARDGVVREGAAGEGGRPGLDRLIATVLIDPDPKIRQLFADEVDPVEGRYLDALWRALPERDPELVLVGYTNMIGLLALQQAGTFTGLRLRARTPGTPAGPVPAAGVEYLIMFLVAGLTSPA